MLGRAYGGGLWWGVFGPHGGRDGHDIYKRGGAGYDCAEVVAFAVWFRGGFSVVQIPKRSKSKGWILCVRTSSFPPYFSCPHCQNYHLALSFPPFGFIISILQASLV